MMLASQTAGNDFMPIQQKSGTSSLLRRQCSCGTHTAGGATCSACQAQEEKQGKGGGLLQRAAVSQVGGPQDPFAVASPIGSGVLGSRTL